MTKRLYRVRKGKWIAGVYGGYARSSNKAGWGNPSDYGTIMDSCTKLKTI